MTYSDLNFGVTFFGTHCIILKAYSHRKLSANTQHISKFNICQLVLLVQQLIQEVPFGCFLSAYLIT